MGIWRDFGRDLRAAFRSRPAETRAIDSLPWRAGGSTAPIVDPGNALSLIPYFASVRILAEQISALPLQTFRKSGELLKRIPDGQLITNPASVVDRVTWTRQAVISLAMRGNAYGLVTSFDAYGFPTGVEWLHPDEIHVDESSPVVPRYYWASSHGYTEIPRDRMLHIAWFVLPGKRKGLSPVQAFASSIGVGLAAQNYGASWFSNGGVPPSTFKNTAKTITDEQADEITSRLSRSLRSGKPLVYGADWDFNAIQINPEEAQFIQTMGMNATQIAAIFGVPPEWVGGETGGSLTYNSPEQNGLHVYKTVLLPWLTLFETNLSRLLPEQQSVKFNPDGVLRADLKTRYESHEIALRAGFLTIDEVRALENRPPLPKPAMRPIVADPSDTKPSESVPADPAKTNGQTNGQRFVPMFVTGTPK